MDNFHDSLQQYDDQGMIFSDDSNFDRRLAFDQPKTFIGLQTVQTLTPSSNFTVQPPYEQTSWANDPYANKPNGFSPTFVGGQIRQDMYYGTPNHTEQFNRFPPAVPTQQFGARQQPLKPMMANDASNPYYSTSNPYSVDPLLQMKPAPMRQQPPINSGMHSFPPTNGHAPRGHSGFSSHGHNGHTNNRTMPPSSMNGAYGGGGYKGSNNNGSNSGHHNMGGSSNNYGGNSYGGNSYGGNTYGAPSQQQAIGGYPAGTGGSNAQGRAINKMLLEILRERVVDPQRLDLAIETYTDRMDCVNLATLLFHTGKKRLLLLPHYIKRIATRFVQLKEELRAREASNALYGLKCMSSELPEVRELLFAVANKLAVAQSDFVAQAVGNALYGLQMMNSEHEEVRMLLHVLSTKVSRCTELLEAQNVGNALYGLRNMNSDHREVRAIISALTPKIATAREDLNGQALGNSLYGLQSMSSKEPEVRFLLAVLATKVSRTWEDLKAQEVGNALYGLKRMSSDVVEVRNLISSLVPKVANSPEILDAQAIGNSFYGLQNMRSDNPEVLSLLAVMAEKVQLSCPELDGQAMGNSLYGLQGMNSDFPEVRAVVTALTAKMQSSCLDMNAQEMGNALFGLQNMTSEHQDVRRLLTALTQKVNSSKHDLTSQEIGNALFGLQGMSSSVWETRMLIRQIAIKIQQSHSIMEPLGVANSLFGLQRLSSECEDVRLLVQSLAIKIEHCWKMLTAAHVSNALYGLQNLSSAENEVRYLLRSLQPKIVSCREEMTAKQAALAVFGMRNLSSEHPEVLALVAAVADKVSLSSEPWQLQHLAMALFGMQGLSSTKEEVGLLLNAVANKAVSLVSEKNVDVASIANALFGMQRMTSAHPDVVRIVTSLLGKVQLIPQNAVVSAKACANMIYGMQGLSPSNEAVKRLLYFVAEYIQMVSSNFMTLPSNGNNSGSNSARLGSSSIANAGQEMYSDKSGDNSNAGDRIEDMLSLYQACTLSLFTMRDLDADSDLQARMYAELSALRSIVDIHKSDLPLSQLSAAERRMVKELSEVLSREPFTVTSGVFVHGFEMCACVQLLPNLQLKTLAGSNWAPVLNIEVRGSSYNFPSKDLFCQLRKKYLEHEKGLLVDTVPAESFRTDGQQGLKIHSAVLSPLYPPTLEDANNFAAKLNSLGIHSNGSNSLLSGGGAGTNYFTFSGVSNPHGLHHMLHDAGAVDYFDDDFKRHPASAANFNESNKKYKFSATNRTHKVPLGMTLSWLGEWPLAIQYSVAASGRTLSPETSSAVIDQQSGVASLLSGNSMILPGSHGGESPVSSLNRTAQPLKAPGYPLAPGGPASPNGTYHKAVSPSMSQHHSRGNSFGNNNNHNKPQQMQQQQHQQLQRHHQSDDDSSSTHSNRYSNPGSLGTSPQQTLDPRLFPGSAAANLNNSNNQNSLDVYSSSMGNPLTVNTTNYGSSRSPEHTPSSVAHTVVPGYVGSGAGPGGLLESSHSGSSHNFGGIMRSAPRALVQPQEGEEGVSMDDEIAALEAQLEVARLEAKLKELKNKKAGKV